VDIVRVGVCFAFLVFFYDVIAQTMSRNCGSQFGWILSCNMTLQSPWSIS